MRRTIAIDLDGVIYNLLQGLSDHLMQAHRVKLDPESVTQYSLAGLTGNEVVDRDIIDRIRDPRFYANLPAYPDAHDALYALKAAGFCVVAVTRRPPAAQQATLLALGRDFPDVFSQVYTTKYKLRKLRAIRAQYGIEDHGDTAVEFARDRIWTYLIARPYNRGVPESRFLKRVEGVGAAAKYILTPLSERLEAHSA